MRRRPNAVVVHHLEHALAALAAAAESGLEVRLLTPPGGAHYAGAPYYAAVARQAAAAHPKARWRATLDCGGDAALALEALAAGWKSLVLRRRGRVWDKVADVARRLEAELLRRPPAALDLEAVDDAVECCRNLLRTA